MCLLELLHCEMHCETSSLETPSGLFGIPVSKSLKNKRKKECLTSSTERVDDTCWICVDSGVQRCLEAVAKADVLVTSLVSFDPFYYSASAGKAFTVFLMLC